MFYVYLINKIKKMITMTFDKKIKHLERLSKIKDTLPKRYTEYVVQDLSGKVTNSQVNSVKNGVSYDDDILESLEGLSEKYKKYKAMSVELKSFIKDNFKDLYELKIKFYCKKNDI